MSTTYDEAADQLREARETVNKDREQWIAWLKGYDPGRLFDSIIANCQGAESVCQYCGELIYFDIVEGGGVPDWGSKFGGNIGLDYGCANSPDTCEEGTGGHLPRGV